VSGIEERICGALLELACERGYRALSVAEVSARAGVSEVQFRTHFGSLEQCALALFDEIQAEFERRVDSAYRSEPEWPDSLRAVAYAVAAWLEENPCEARFGSVEMLWVSELAQARREAGFQRFVSLIDAGRAVAAEPDSIPAATAESVIGSIAALVTKRLQGGGLKPRALVPELMSVAVRPYLGKEAAERELQIHPPPERRVIEP
jgi:AcrR family transcriptional regulator